MLYIEGSRFSSAGSARSTEWFHNRVLFLFFKGAAQYDVIRVSHCRRMCEECERGILVLDEAVVSSSRERVNLGVLLDLLRCIVLGYSRISDAVDRNDEPYE